MKSYLLSAFAMLFALHYAVSQDLEEQFNAMMEKSSNYQEYKVINKEEISSYWLQIADTLAQRKSQISGLYKQIDNLESRIDSLQSSLNKVSAELAASKQVNDTISFLGAELSKPTYHIIVWAIIIILVALAVLAYMMYHNSHRVTNKVKQEYAQLNRDYEEHRDKSREMQVKLKRELQTAVNTIEEMKRGGSSRR